MRASCGAVSCFVVIGSQQEVPMTGLLTVNAIYNYTPSWTPAGEGGSIPFANQENRTLTLANLNSAQIWTHVATGTLDMNYGTVPHRINVLGLTSYRHTFKNNDGYQFGDEVNLSGGFNLVPLEQTQWLVLTQQVNYRWMQNDAMDASLFQFNPA